MEDNRSYKIAMHGRGDKSKTKRKDGWITSEIDCRRPDLAIFQASRIGDQFVLAPSIKSRTKKSSNLYILI